MESALNGQESVFGFLVSQGSDLRNVAGDNNTILHLSCIGGDTDIVRTLVVNKGHDIESKGYRNRTPVLVAALNGNKEVFDFLVSRGSDTTVVDDQKDTILHLACVGGHVDIVKYIESHDIVDRESRGFVGRTTVMAAVLKGNKGIFDFLVSRGCDLSVVDDHKNTVLHLACWGSNVDIVQYIVSHNIADIESRGLIGRTPVMASVLSGNRGIFNFLVSRGCDLTVLDNNKDNILHLACCGGNADIVKYIVSHNIVDIESRGFAGRTPLMSVTESVTKEIIDFLVSNGGKLTTRDDGKNTILHVACICGYTEMVQYLLTLPIVQGMKKVKNKHNKTPAQVAEKNGHTALVSVLKALK